MTKIKLIRSRFLIPMTDHNGNLDRIEDGYVLFNKKIIECGSYNNEIGERIILSYGDRLQIIGYDQSLPFTEHEIPRINGVLLPGFVKTHGHDHESVLIGIARDVPLTEWLDMAVNPFTEFLHTKEGELKKELGKSPYLVAYEKARIDDIMFGITTALTHHCNFNKYHVDELAEANINVGTRIFIAIGSQDRNYYEKILDSVDDALDRLNSSFDKYRHNPRVSIIPGPDQLFSNGPELLQALKKWATNHQSLIHIHSSEEPNTTKWFVETYKQTPVEYALSINFLDDLTMLAHQVNTTTKDVKIIADNNSIVVHNSLANTILGSGMPPIIDMIKSGVRVTISTDGSGSADSQNMLAAARLTSQFQKSLYKDATILKAEDVLKRVTKLPAEILGINGGTLEEGKDADLIIVDLSKPNLTPTRKENLIENLIWASAGNEISYVFADGNCLIDKYNFVSIDIDLILRDVQKLAKLFDEYRQKSPEIYGTGAPK